MTSPKPVLRIAAIAAAAALTACSGSDDVQYNTLPSGTTVVSVTNYSATSITGGNTAASQDLLTGGLGKTGLANGVAPTYANPAAPTAAELRRNGLWANYRAILDFSANGGFGTVYGPNIDLAGNNTLGEGLIPGKEYLAFLDDGTGHKQVTIAIQIPKNFNVDAPCIVAGPSSGSRGVYGAIATAGEWGLKKGCAVALTDAGKGVGLYDPNDDTVNKIDGTRATRLVAGALSNFAATITEAARNAFVLAFPNRVALKQVHSQVNPEKDWGTDTLSSIRLAFYALNEEYALTGGPANQRMVRFSPANTIVIAGSASNGGGAVLHAAEQDTDGLIDGVVADEPSAQPTTQTGYGVNVGGTLLGAGAFGLPLVDIFTTANIFQPCAALAPAATMAEVSIYNYMTLTAMNARATSRCASLAAKGLLPGVTVADTTATQATAALAILNANGFTADNVTMHNHIYGLGNEPIIGAMYTTGFGRFSLTDNVCNTSFAQVDGTGVPVAVTAASKAQSFAIANGTANGTPVSVVYNDSVGGAKVWSLAVSPSTGVADFGLDTALCERALVTGKDPVTGAALPATPTGNLPSQAQSDRVKTGIAEAQLSGNLRGKPTIIVTGRSDALVPINHASRSYVAYNSMVEGGSNVHYYEIEHGQHFDTFLPFSGFDTRFVPIHPYYVQSMNMMYDYLTKGTALPASRVVRTTVRGGAPGAAPALTLANVPAIPAAAPAAGDAITVTAGHVVMVP